MATFEETLVSLIEDGSSVKCYPLEKPQNLVTPAAVYKRISTGRERIHGVKSTFNRVRISLVVYGQTYAAVRSAVSTINGLLDENTTSFSLAYLSDQQDFKEPEAGLFFTYLEYVLFGHLD